MRESRQVVRVAHFDGLGAHEIVDALAVAEREAGVPSDLGWISDALGDPQFTLVTVGDDTRLWGFCCAGRAGGTVLIRNLVTVTDLPDPSLDRPWLITTLVDTLLRVAGFPRRELGAVRDSEAFQVLTAMGWAPGRRLPGADSVGQPGTGPAAYDVVVLHRSPATRW